MTGAEAVTYRLNVPPVPPAPVPGCAACKGIAERRAKAQAEGDYSSVSDCNVRLLRHHQPPISR